VKKTELFDLAGQCQVNMHAACRRAGVSYSTVHRWKTGSEGRPDTVEKVRRAILVLAHEAHTAPADKAVEAKEIFMADMSDLSASRSPREIVRDIQRNAQELARALGV